VSSWPGHANVEITFTNTGEKTISNWNFICDIPYNIDNIWNGQITDSNGESTYNISCYDWNRDISPGSSVTVGMTLSSIDSIDITELPTRYILNTKKVVVDPNGYTISYVEHSRWDEGFTGALTIRTNEIIEDWSMSFISSEEICEVSGATLIQNDTGSITLSGSDNNRDISPDSPATV